MTRIIIDTETTGLSPLHDEILQLAIIDADTGERLHCKKYGVAKRLEWPAAEDVNGISPKDVSGLPSLYDSDEQTAAAEIIGAADWVGGWNTEFDLKMLWAYQIAPRDDAEIVDIMKLDAEICGTYTPLQGGSAKYRSLMNAATWWGFELKNEPGVFHDAYVDCRATRFVWRCIMQWKNAVWNTRNRAVYLDARKMMRDIMQSCSWIQSEMLNLMLEPDDAASMQPYEVKIRLRELQNDLKFLAGMFEYVSTSAGMNEEEKKKNFRDIINGKFGFGVD